VIYGFLELADWLNATYICSR